MGKIMRSLLWLLFAGARRRRVVTVNVNRLLVIKLCCIGDVLFATPLLRALRANFPRTQITFMVVPGCRDLVDGNANVAGIIEFDPYARARWWNRLSGVWRAVRAIRAGRFDAAVVLHRSSSAGLLTWAGGVRIRIGFNAEGRGFCLTHPVPYREEAHEVDRYLDCLQPLGAAPVGTHLELDPGRAAEIFAENFMREHGLAVRGERPLIAVFPGGGVNPGSVMNSKRWLTGGFREVCRELAARYQCRLLFVGSAEDAPLGDEVLAAEAWQPPPLRAEGRTDLRQLAALLKSCDLFIGGDSGPLHIAAAVDTPTVSIFGPTDPKLLAPRGKKHRTVVTAVECAPCYTPRTAHDAGVTSCRRGDLVCMHRIAPADVVAAADSLLQEKGYQPR